VSSSPSDGRIRVLLALEGVLGGTLRHLDNLLRHADRREFDIHLAVSPLRAPHVRRDFRRWRAGGWRVHEIAMRREISPAADARAFAALLALCRRERFDIVHTHCAKAGFLGRLAGRMTGARTVHTPHVFPFHLASGARAALYLALERVASRWTDRFIVLSNYQLNVLIGAGLAGPERAVVVPNGVAPEEFAGPGREAARLAFGLEPAHRVLLFAGRFREQKGLDVLLEATSRLVSRTPGLRLLIAGEGPLEGWLRREVAARGLRGVVSLLGQSDRMPLCYAACDLVVMPSRSEGMPCRMRSHVPASLRAWGRRPASGSLRAGAGRRPPRACSGCIGSWPGEAALNVRRRCGYKVRRRASGRPECGSPARPEGLASCLDMTRAMGESGWDVNR